MRGGVGGARSGGTHISVRAYAKYNPTAVTAKPSLPNRETGTIATTDFAGCGLESRSMREMGGTEQITVVEVEDRIWCGSVSGVLRVSSGGGGASHSSAGSAEHAGDVAGEVSGDAEAPR